MAEYKRFIAYFYEYIEDRRGRNAGFVKAELRNGTWRFRIQLRAARWPKESLEIFGFFMQDGTFRTALLGKGYPRGDSLIQTLVFSSKEVSEHENFAALLERLSGIWIPAGKGWYYLSNWEERKVDIRMLEASRSSLPVFGEPDAVKERKTDAGANPEESEKQADAGELEKKAAGAKELEKKTAGAKELEKKAAEAEELGKKVETEELGEKTVTEESGKGKITFEQGVDTDEKRGYEVEAMECMEEPDQARRPEEMDQFICPEEIDQRKGIEETAVSRRVEQTWNILRSRCRVVHPFAEDSSEYLCASPKDVRWLGMQGWPIGQNSFLMQSFCRYHHILVGRNGDGKYMLGVPGMHTMQIRSYAAHFGFSEFRKASEGGFSDDFGYWVREFFPAIWKKR